MAKMVRIRAITSFNGIRKGDESTVERTTVVEGWINAQVVEVVKEVAERVVAEAKALRPIVEPGWVTATRKRGGRGEDPTGPGGAESHDPGGVPFGAGDSGAAGDEPGQGFGSGGYGAAEGVDQD